ncbi:MAG TPA: HAD-IC family P-type ATPase, partial [Acidimicrobiia bacterium]|nr:HAD-IC family P-type ATPase [Acidimicrobiia bacterium]
QNRMAVVEAWTPSGGAIVRGQGYEPVGEIEATDAVRAVLTEAAQAGLLCSNGRAVEREGIWVAQGDPMEAALHVLALRLDGATDPSERKVVARFPFDARRRRMSVVTEHEVLVKGAPDAVLPCCCDHGSSTRALNDMTARGLRVLAVARRSLRRGELPLQASDAERDLELLALLAFEDPPRSHAADAIERCRRAGMRVAMVTGDHPMTALAIAREVGLARDDTVVVEGHDLPEDDEVLGATVDRDGVVLARITPEDKLRVARALRARGHVVAMTGDGVNDGPALREADIGVAMGSSGTDVAREAADLVLLDDDFATIVAAIEQGRSTFANLRRFLTYHLTDNVAELTPFVIWALSGGRFPLAIGVLQVLALDIGTDTLPAVALGAEQPSLYALEGPPDRGRLLNGRVARRAFGVLGPAEAIFAMLAFVVSLVASGWRVGTSFPDGPPLLAASGAAFASIVLGQAANAFACRSSRRPVYALHRPANRFLRIAVAIEIATLALFLWVRPLADLLDQAAPTAAGLAVALLTPIAVVAADALDKARRRRQRDDPRYDRAVARPAFVPRYGSSTAAPVT